MQPAQGLRRIASPQLQFAVAAGGPQGAIELGVQARSRQVQRALAAFFGGLDFELALQFGIVGTNPQRRQRQRATRLLRVPGAGGLGVAQAQLLQKIVLAGMGSGGWPAGGRVCAGHGLNTGIKPQVGALAAGFSLAVQRQGGQLGVQLGGVDASEGSSEFPGLRRCRRGCRCRFACWRRLCPFATGQQFAASQLRLDAAHHGHAISPFALAVQLLQRQALLVPGAGQRVGDFQLQGPGLRGGRWRGRGAGFEWPNAGAAGQQCLRHVRQQRCDVEVAERRIGLRQGLRRPGHDACGGARLGLQGWFCGIGSRRGRHLQFGLDQQLAQGPLGGHLHRQRHPCFAVGNGRIERA